MIESSRSIFRRLLELVSNFKPKTSAKDGEVTDRITYDIYARPSEETDAQTEKVRPYFFAENLEFLPPSRNISRVDLVYSKFVINVRFIIFLKKTRFSFIKLINNES